MEVLTALSPGEKKIIHTHKFASNFPDFTDLFKPRAKNPRSKESCELLERCVASVPVLQQACGSHVLQNTHLNSVWEPPPEKLKWEILDDEMWRSP